MRPFIAALPLLVTLVPSPSHAETLAEAAAREAARRGQQKVAKKAPVYTEGELGRVGTNGTFTAMTRPVEKAALPAHSSPSPPPPVTSDAAVSVDSAQYRRGGRTEREWFDAAAQLELSIGFLTEQIQIREENLRGNFERQVLAEYGERPSPHKAAERLRLTRARLKMVEEALAELKDEARRYNVPPRWLRGY
jgi:hypothetical protein